jgi:hypothetical protein
MQIKGIEIKKFKELKHGHGDSRTFEAEIHMDGMVVGFVSNNGWGGCNEYHFDSKEKREVFNSRVKEYGQENKLTFEVEDDIIEELILGIEKEKVKKQNIRKGFPVTLVCYWNKEIIGNREFFNKIAFIGLKTEAQIKPYIKSNKVEKFEVV